MIKFAVGGVAYGTLPPIVDSVGSPLTPTSVTAKTYKNGSTTATGDSVTILTYTDANGLSGWSYNPAGESEFDVWRIQIEVVISGISYYHTADIQAVVPERGTDSALTTLGTNAPTDWLNGNAVKADAVTKIQANLALAATALSNVQWTNALATAIGTTNSTVATNLNVAISVIQSQITALNNLSAKANWFGNQLLEIPDAATRAYVFELVIKDDEDKLANLDGVPTVTLVNSAGTDRSALITSALVNVATGRYKLTINVDASTVVNETLTLSAVGTISAEARYAVVAMQVVDYDNATQVALILTRLGIPVSSIAADLAAVGVNVATVNTKIGTPVASVSADIASIKADATNLLARITAPVYQLWLDLMSMITGSGVSPIFTVPALSNAPAGGGGSGGGLTTEQAEQLDFIETQCALFSQPTGSYLLTISGDYLCLRADLELLFGTKNVAKWADIDGDNNATFITNRISTMIALADDQMRAALGDGPYTLPVAGETIPPQVCYHCSCLAGVLLYESRGSVDYDDNGNAEHAYSMYRLRYNQFVQDVNSLRLKLNLVAKDGNTAPSFTEN